VNLLIEGHLCETSTPFGVPAAARMIHKNVADDLRAGRSIDQRQYASDHLLRDVQSSVMLNQAK
jgi:hypothetical protein